MTTDEEIFNRERVKAGYRAVSQDIKLVKVGDTLQCSDTGSVVQVSYPSDDERIVIEQHSEQCPHGGAHGYQIVVSLKGALGVVRLDGLFPHENGRDMQ